MKNLSEYPTPETDAFQLANESSWRAHSANIERRLAACREELENISQISSSSRIRRIARETLTATAKP